MEELTKKIKSVSEKNALVIKVSEFLLAFDA